MEVLPVMPVKRKLENATRKISSKLGIDKIVSTITNPSSTSQLGARSVEWIYLIVIFLLAGGVVNAISNAGLAGITSQPIVPNPTVQNVIETFILLFTYIVGALGAYSLFLSGKQTVRARSSEMFFAFGIVLLLVAVSLGYYVLSQK